MADPEDSEDAEETKPKKTVFFQGAEPFALPTWVETKGTAKEIKQDVINFVGEEVMEIITQPAKATVANVLGRIRSGINAFLAPTVPGPTCEHTTNRGGVCGKPVPCRYPSHRSN